MPGPVLSHKATSGALGSCSSRQECIKKKATRKERLLFVSVFAWSPHIAFVLSASAFRCHVYKYTLACEKYLRKSLFESRSFDRIFGNASTPGAGPFSTEADADE